MPDTTLTLSGLIKVLIRPSKCWLELDPVTLPITIIAVVILITEQVAVKGEFNEQEVPLFILKTAPPAGAT